MKYELLISEVGTKEGVMEAIDQAEVTFRSRGSALDEKGKDHVSRFKRMLKAQILDFRSKNVHSGVMVDASLRVLDGRTETRIEVTGIRIALPYEARTAEVRRDAAEEQPRRVPVCTCPPLNPGALFICAFHKR